MMEFTTSEKEIVVKLSFSKKQFKYCVLFLILFFITFWLLVPSYTKQKRSQLLHEWQDKSVQEKFSMIHTLNLRVGLWGDIPPEKCAAQLGVKILRNRKAWLSGLFSFGDTTYELVTVLDSNSSLYLIISHDGKGNIIGFQGRGVASYYP